MQATRYTVKSGDTLWSIARAHYGAGHRWPEIYAYNNFRSVVAKTGHRIVNPNLIKSGQTIYLPQALRISASQPLARPTQPPIPRNDNPAGAARPGGGQRPAEITEKDFSHNSSRNPADLFLVNNLGVFVELNKFPAIPVLVPGFRGTMKFKGRLFVMNTTKTPLVTLSNVGAEIQAEQVVNHQINNFLRGFKIKIDPAGKNVAIENNLSVQVGSSKVTLTSGVDTQGPYLKATTSEKVNNRLGVYVLSGTCQIDLELRPDNFGRPGLSPQPVSSWPMLQPAPSPWRTVADGTYLRPPVVPIGAPAPVSHETTDYSPDRNAALHRALGLACVVVIVGVVAVTFIESGGTSAALLELAPTLLRVAPAAM